MSLKSKSYNEMPDFLIIGAGKSGTTSLNNYLKQHPDIYIHPFKEPNFFGYELYSYEDFVNKKLLKHYRESITELNSYLKLFSGAKEGMKKGETSNSYLYLPDAPLNIKKHIPHVKLIAILRHPVDRLYSRFMHLCRENRQPDNTFINCLDTDSVWWKRNDLVPEGFYGKYLSRYYSLFDSNQIKVFLYEDLVNRPLETIMEMYRFIEVDENFTPDMSIRFNKSGLIKNKFINKLIGQNGLIKNFISFITPLSVYSKLKESNLLQKKVNDIRRRNLKVEKLDAGSRQLIIDKVYRDDIMILEELLQRKLNWL